MDNRKQNLNLALSLVNILAIIALVAMSVFGGGAQTVFTPQAAGHPLVYLEGGKRLVIQAGGEFWVTPGATVDIVGASGAYSGNNIITGAQKVIGATAATTATPVSRVGNSADVNDNFVVEKDETPVFIVGNGGAITRSGTDTLTGAFVHVGNVVQTAPTAATTATPGFYVNNAADVNDNFVVGKDGTAEFIVGNAGALDMTGNAISNIGSTSTDFSSSGGLTLADDLLMSNQPILNIGAAGTDFQTDGGLTTAAGISVTTGGLIITAGGATITAGGLDMTNDAISNIGAAGTDFSATGGLTLADSMVVSAGGITVTAGGMSLAGNNRWVCTYAEEVAATNENLGVVSPCYVIAVSTSINADYTLLTTNIVTGTLVSITQIGAGTLVITDTNLISSDGNAISLGANDSALFLFDGAKWNGLLKLAGS